MRRFIDSSCFPTVFVGANIPACPEQRKRASRAGITGQNRLAAAGGFEIPCFRHGRPYFGFADHVK
jgi:hypothetical protein